MTNTTARLTDHSIDSILSVVAKPTRRHVTHDDGDADDVVISGKRARLSPQRQQQERPEKVAPSTADDDDDASRNGASSCGVTVDPVVKLEFQNLWQDFYSLCTEMVITKSGRFVIYEYIFQVLFGSSTLWLYAGCISGVAGVLRWVLAR